MADDGDGFILFAVFGENLFAFPHSFSQLLCRLVDHFFF